MALFDLLATLDDGNLLGVPRPAYGGYQFDLPPAANGMPTPQMPAAAPHDPSKFRNFLGAIGDALMVGGGGQPLYRQRMEAQRAQNALSGFLTNPDAAIAQLMQIDAPSAIALYKAVHPASETPQGVKEFEYAKANGYTGSFADFLKITHPGLLAPVTLGPNDTIESGDTGGTDSGGEITATNPKTGEKVRWNGSAWEPVKGGQSGGGSAGGFSVTALNNPGALRVPGSKRFQRFASPEEGAAAQEAQLGRYMSGAFSGDPLRTVASIVETYAPRRSRGGDNSDASVNNYIGYVARRLGVNPRDALSDAVLPRLAQAMREFETGRRVN